MISTRNRPADLRRCLDAIRKSLGPQDEIVVVDSASTDREIVSEIAQSFGARAYRCEEPGAARARNLGIRHSNGAIIAFTDDDALVDPGWLEALILPFRDASIGAVVGPVFQLGHDPPCLLIDYASFDAARERSKFDRRDPDWLERIRLGAIGSGANFAARREMFERHGRFRECLGAGAPIAGDEIFFFLSIVAKGETIINEPSAKVFHPVQLDGRFGEILDSRAAYWIYASFNFPQIVLRALPAALRRLTRKRGRIAGTPRLTGRLNSVRCAPRLLLSAWRFSRFR